MIFWNKSKLNCVKNMNNTLNEIYIRIKEITTNRSNPSFQL